MRYLAKKGLGPSEEGRTGFHLHHLICILTVTP